MVQQSIGIFSILLLGRDRFESDDLSLGDVDLITISNKKSHSKLISHLEKDLRRESFEPVIFKTVNLGYGAEDAHTTREKIKVADLEKVFEFIKIFVAKV